jgi:hypothetical protein
MTKVCPKCKRDFNPALIRNPPADPRGWCWWCANGYVLPKHKKKKPEKEKP